METLRPIASMIKDDHVDHLEKERMRKPLYKRVKNGKMYGHGVTLGSLKYKKYRQKNIPLRALRPEEKLYPCRSLFQQSFNSIFTPECHECQKKSCPYCRLRTAGHHLHGEDPLLALASALTQPDAVWGEEKFKDNFVRTRTLMTLFRSDPTFMGTLTRLLLIRIVPNDEDQNEEDGVYFPSIFQNIIFLFVLILIVWATV